MNLHKIIIFAIALLLPVQSHASPLIEYQMSLPTSASAKRVALTFDACTGKLDERILNTLIDHKIKATIFVTARWLKRNPAAITSLKANADLFEIGNHGAKHLVAIDSPRAVFGNPAAGSPQAIVAEIDGGTAAILQSFSTAPAWFRGATATYTKSSIHLIARRNTRLAGFTFAGDGGASFSNTKAAKVIKAANDGDIILAHINHPEKPAGAGVVAGILALQKAGFNFVTLSEGYFEADRGR